MALTPPAKVYTRARMEEESGRNLTFETSTNKDVVRRILALHYRPAPDADGPSWLTFLGHMKDSLWSLDLTSMRIASIEDLLGADGYGSVHSTDHRIWNSGRSRQR
jgi:hypothetical protein